MPQYFNDSPIERREDDSYSVHAFAEAPPRCSSILGRLDSANKPA